VTEDFEVKHMAGWVCRARGRAEQRRCKSTGTNGNRLLRASRPSSPSADGTRRSTEDAEETHTHTHSRSTSYAERRGRKSGCRHRDGCRSYDGWAAVLMFYGTLDITHVKSVENRDIFLDRILETSDATYRHQSCMTAVSHTHTHTEKETKTI